MSSASIFILCVVVIVYGALRSGPKGYPKPPRSNGPPSRRWRRCASIAPWLLLAAWMTLFAACGCHAVPAVANPAKVSTPELARDVQQHVVAADGHVQQIATVAKTLPETPAKGQIAAQASSAHDELAAASQVAKAAETASASDAKTVAEQQKQIENLKASDPVRAWLYLIGIGLLVAGVALIVLHFVWLQLPWGDEAGGAALIMGGVLVVLAHWIHLLEWSVLILAAAFAVFYAWQAWRRHRKALPMLLSGVTAQATTTVAKAVGVVEQAFPAHPDTPEPSP